MLLFFFYEYILKKLIDIIWTIIKISEKKENEYLIIIINFEGKRERERRKRKKRKDRDKNSMCSEKFFKSFFRTSNNLFNLKIRF